MILLLWACLSDEKEAPGVPPVVLSPTAREELHQALVDDMNATRHPSDGGGSVVLTEGPSQIAAGGRGRWTLVYTAGPQGIEVGGGVYLQIPPFWEWSPPQTGSPDGPGYTTVTTKAPGVSLEVELLDQGLLRAAIMEGPLAEGQQVTFVYGAGPAMSQADAYAEHDAALWMAVDGNGDGIRRLVKEPATIDVQPSGVAGLVIFGPASAKPGQSITYRVAALDSRGNAGTTVPDAFVARVTEGDAAISTAPFHLDEKGLAQLTVQAKGEGVLRVAVLAHGEPVAVSNPALVSATTPRWVWGDLHGHSQLSDGTGTPNDYFWYARHVGALDVVSLTDHDHWGMEHLASTPALWQKILSATEAHHAPGHFVALPGYEWTSWLHGHRHVLWFSQADPGRQRIYDSVAPETSTPQQLWDALRGSGAMTIAHHSAGGPIATNWTIPPDPELEPITEVVSVHGSSEASDSPGLIYNPVPGNFVRDALGMGYQLGFVGSGDTHDGHPGLGHLITRNGGLAAIQTETLDRASVRDALQNRRTYATNGPRIVLRTTLGQQPMGSKIGPGTHSLTVFVAAPGPLERIELIRGPTATTLTTCDQGFSCSTQSQVADLEAGEFVYVRVLQTDGGAAWSSPFFVEGATTGPG